MTSDELAVGRAGGGGLERLLPPQIPWSPLSPLQFLEGRRKDKEQDVEEA